MTVLSPADHLAVVPYHQTQGFAMERVSMSTVLFRKRCVLPLVAGVTCLQRVPDCDGEGNRHLANGVGAADPTVWSVNLDESQVSIKMTVE